MADGGTPKLNKTTMWMQQYRAHKQGCMTQTNSTSPSLRIRLVRTQMDIKTRGLLPQQSLLKVLLHGREEERSRNLQLPRPHHCI